MQDPVAATEKAKDLVRMAINKAREIVPLDRISLSVNHAALVIGGGISGIVAAQNFGEQGFETYLVEKEPVLGGFARNIFTTLDGEDVQRFLTDRIEKLKTNQKIHIFTEAKIQNIDGFVGNFNTIVKHGPDQKTAEFKHGIVVVATGADEYQPHEYLYGTDPRIITQSQFERTLHTSGVTPGVNSIVMIQCVGSRNKEHPYCSKMCCSEAIKNALYAKKIDLNINISILFRDVRTYGFKEDYYRKAREAGIIFIKYDENDLPAVKKGDNELLIELNQPKLGKISIQSDLLVLSVGIVAHKDNEELAKVLKVPVNEDKFFLEAHVKLRPVDFATEGVFLAGMAHCPKPIEDSIAQANAAVSRACTILSKDKIEAEGKIAMVDPARCTACGMCVSNCAYNAVSLIEDKRWGMIASVNAAMCHGCGACAGNCRCSAIEIGDFTGEQIFSMIVGRC